MVLTGALADAFSASCSQLLEDHTPGEDSYQLLSTCTPGKRLDWQAD
jgi:hypothetical protein